MTTNRLKALGLIVLGSYVLAAATSCDSSAPQTESSAQGGSSQGTGGLGNGSGGSSAKSTLTGGANPGVGGTPNADGGEVSAGGNTSCSSTPTATKADNCAKPTITSGSFTVSNGNYFKLGSYAGYGYVYISPTKNSADSVTCDNSSFGSGTLTALCGAGVVPADCNHDAVGGVGFNLAQPTSGGDPAPAVANTVHQAVVTFTNTANTELRFQIVKFDGTTKMNYCYDATGKSSPVTIGASDFTSTCYLADSVGTAWDGASAESFQFIVPSRGLEQGQTPFDVCLQNVEFS